MNIVETQEHIHTPEIQYSPHKIFEFLYPEKTWESLPFFTIKNILTLINVLSCDSGTLGDVIEQKIHRAQKQRMEYIMKIPLPHTDKLLLSFYLTDCVPIPYQPNRSYFEEFLLQEETVGGQVRKDYIWLDPQTLHSFCKNVRFIGVLKNNAPSGLLVYKESLYPPHFHC